MIGGGVGGQAASAEKERRLAEHRLFSVGSETTQVGRISGATGRGERESARAGAARRWSGGRRQTERARVKRWTIEYWQVATMPRRPSGERDGAGREDKRPSGRRTATTGRQATSGPTGDDAERAECDGGLRRVAAADGARATGPA
ncbi:uncharacterized protein A4U43_C09F8520 [Asparagus officinalis]|uniref:Uncharacterized protein n=1 Tax=Asparagus officinalis TaxID=4686 RepID=A0A5P1E6F0_ASPOF|nr:uncharacterized protein A4U43_C09F8520 [Asparagus officinalis]